MLDRAARALGLIEDLSSAPNVARAIDVFQLALDPFGVRLFRTGTVGNPYRTERMRPVGAEIDNWSQDWTRFYFGSGAFSFDPTVVAARRGEGFYWHDLPPADTRKARQLMEEAASQGMVDGFTAIRNLPGELPTAVSMAGEPIDWSPLERGVVTFVANSLMARMLYLRDVQLTPAVETLTEREVHILHLAALGKHDPEIAEEICRSEHTVRDHWKSIRRKLGAVDRANAVAIGLWSGQIAP